MLAAVSDLQTLCGVSDPGPLPLLSLVLAAADAAVKKWTHRDLEQQGYTEYYSGTQTRDLCLRQYPVLRTPTPQVYYDPSGYYGDGPGAFAAGTLLAYGTTYVLVQDQGGRSNRGLLRRIGGLGGAGTWPELWPGEWRGTLAGRRLPYWWRGDGNLKVVYTAGYSPIPADLSMACLQLAAFIRRTGPSGAALQSETLGQYTYSVLAFSQIPEIGTVRGILATYRDASVGTP